MTKNKVTLKNIMVYDYLRRVAGSETSVKKIYTTNKAEITKLFGISTYASFNFHIRKVINFESNNKYKLDESLKRSLQNGQDNS